MSVTLSRRAFVSQAARASAFLTLHHALTRPRMLLALETPQILGLELECAAPLEAMTRFYQSVIGLPVNPHRDAVTVIAGLTRITFIKASSQAAPFYHFAFNIPENKIVAARHWQTARTPLLPIQESLRDPGMPPDVVNYRHWNAHSIFFFDPAGNVVEYIARHDLANGNDRPFDVNDILYASEIAFVVDDVPVSVKDLRLATGLDAYGAVGDAFAALGDTSGLLLVMRRGRVISFESPQRKAVDVYRTRVALRGTTPVLKPLAGYPYELERPR